MYITLDDPLLEFAGDPIDPEAGQLFETVIDIACRNASGARSKSKAVSKIWSDFTDLRVRRKKIDGFNKEDNTVMKYWRPRPKTCQYMVGMISTDDGVGTCGAWSQLFINAIRFVGIDGPEMLVMFSDISQEFMVRNWRFGKHIRSGENGVCNTPAAKDDFQKKSIGSSVGEDEPCVTPGDNGQLDSEPKEDDTIQDGLRKGSDFPYVLEREKGNKNPNKVYGIRAGDVSNILGSSLPIF